MRIRKHAARILSSLTIPAKSCAGTTTVAAVETAAGRELEMHVCELNQSPWDAMAFTPPGTVSIYHYEVQQEEEDAEENGFLAGATWSGQIEEEPAAAVSDVSRITATRSTWRRQAKMEEAAEGAEEEEKSEWRVEKRNSSHNTKKIKRKTTSSCAVERAEDEKVKMEVESAATATAAPPCKKSDGKGWHCKREALRPHSLCEYHLNQVRSYYSNGASTTHVLLQQQQQQSLRKMHGGGIVDAKQSAALISGKKNIKKKTSKKEDKSRNGNRCDISSNCAARRTKRKPAPSDYYYYYSGFGPWWGRRRNGVVGDGAEREAINVDASNGDDDGHGAYDGAAAPKVHDQAPDDLDDDDDDVDGVDDIGGYDGEDVARSKRRARKPIKARSLKSLL